MGTVALEKKPRAVDQDGARRTARAREAIPQFNRDAILEALFALPIPPSPAGGRRSYPIHTPLGRIMRLQCKQKRHMVAFPGTPNERALTEMLAGRRDVGNYRVPLAGALGVDPRLL